MARVDGAVLHFEALNKSDDGVYLCHAENSIGNNQGKYTLLVQGNKKKSKKKEEKLERGMCCGEERD